MVDPPCYCWENSRHFYGPFSIARYVKLSEGNQGFMLLSSSSGQARLWSWDRKVPPSASRISCSLGPTSGRICSCGSHAWGRATMVDESMSHVVKWLPSDNQTWKWKIPELNGGFNRKIMKNYWFLWSIFHHFPASHVWWHQRIIPFIQDAM